MKTATSDEVLKAPFPWFGGKSRIAEAVWDRFGNVANYVEPFFGSGAVLLARPHPPRIETVNDADCYLTNFWRAVQADPEAVAKYADWPVSELDQHARHLWLVSNAELRERMIADPGWYDPKAAGWWVWGQSIWIGSGWCARQFWRGEGDAGTGVHRKLVNIGNNGKGIHRQSDQNNNLVDYLQALSNRLRRVRICCGDWTRVTGPSATYILGTTAIFLDPPYSPHDGNCDIDLYSMESVTIADEVCNWAILHGDNPKLRIALCGYEGDYELPRGWECLEWKAKGGYGSQSDGQARANSKRERIWFSPHCLLP